jgi:Zn-dependent peptidase ImmA (M78 family)/transcriptional regulator with XRE-family HTH domain
MCADAGFSVPNDRYTHLMTTRATAVTPELLVWARERAGLTLEDAAHYVSKSADDVEAWEAGTAWPTYKQLEKLARGLYHRPVALFFLPEPPEETAARQEFRTLPDFDVAHLSADTRYALRLGRAYQQSLRDLSGGQNLSPRHICRDFRLGTSSDTATDAARLRTYLGVSMDRQRGWKSTADAMAAWRAHVEDAGVFVFKRSFSQREISGFCLVDEEFPIIMINNSVPFSRQIFTLLHELAHLLHGVSSLTTVDGRFVDRMSGRQQSVEILCNKLASEVVFPSDAMPWSRIDRSSPIQSVSEIAREFKVSREVVLRRLLDRGWVDSETYEHYAQQWASEAEAGRGGEGGDYYYNQAAYLGDAYLRLAFSRYRAGLLDAADMAEHLGIKAKNLSKFEDKIVGRL